MARQLDTRGASLARPTTKDELDHVPSKGPYGSPDEKYEECRVLRSNGSGGRTQGES